MQKAKLDKLENWPEVRTKEKTDRDEAPVKQPGIKWAFNKLLLICIPVAFLLFVIAGVLWFYLSRPVGTENKQKHPAYAIQKADNIKTGAEGGKEAALPPLKLSTVYFRDFIIDLKDKTGKSRILMCDVAVDVAAAGSSAELEKNKDVRKLIYQTTGAKNAVVLRSIEERRRLKNELQQKLEKMLGEGIVKNVYFVNYVIM